MTPPDPILEARDVRFGFPDRPDFLGPIDLEIRPGEFWGIIGPNGAGKTTLLRLLAGIWKPRAGDVLLERRALRAVPALQRARRTAYLPQKLLGDPDASVLETVLMGRYPHRGYGLFESPDDHHAARRAMEATETLALAERTIGTLSGGEAQRVHLAATLAQAPRVFLLDEPTAALDLSHQLSVFAMLARMAAETGAAIVVVTHDLNLAGRHCDRLALIADGKLVALGPTAEVLLPDRLGPVYGVRFHIHREPGDGRPWLLPVDAHNGTGVEGGRR